MRTAFKPKNSLTSQLWFSQFSILSLSPSALQNETISTFFITYSVIATLTSSLFLQHTREVSCSTSSWIPSAWNAHIPHTQSGKVHHSFRSSIVNISVKGSLATLSKNNTHSYISHSLSLFYFLPLSLSLTYFLCSLQHHIYQQIPSPEHSSRL